MGKIGLLGAGGMAREAASYCLDNVKFFAVDGAYLDHNNPALIDIQNPTEEQRLTKIVSALGSPAVRRAMIEAWPGTRYGTIVARSAEILTEQLGDGMIIAPGAIITTNTEIGDHSIVNIGATVSHDCRLGNYTTISPGAHIAGNVELGDGVFVGIGATISNGIRVAEGAVIGAGAVVIRDIDVPYSVVVGNPAHTIKVGSGWLEHV